MPPRKEYVDARLEFKDKMYDGPAVLQALIQFAEEYPDFHFDYDTREEYGDFYLSSIHVYGSREATKEEAKEIRAKRKEEKRAADEWRLKREAEIEAEERKQYEELKRKFGD